MPLLNSIISTLISTYTSKLQCFLSCLKPIRRPITIIRSSTSLYAFTIIQIKCKKQKTSYMLLSRAPTLFIYIQLSLNVFSIKLTVRTSQTSIRSLCFKMVLILYFVIDLLSSLTSLANTLILYESSNNQPVVPRLLYNSLMLPLLAILIDTTILNPCLKESDIRLKF